jgi:hypothetical protein
MRYDIHNLEMQNRFLHEDAPNTAGVGATQQEPSTPQGAPPPVKNDQDTNQPNPKEDVKPISAPAPSTSNLPADYVGQVNYYRKKYASKPMVVIAINPSKNQFTAFLKGSKIEQQSLTQIFEFFERLSSGEVKTNVVGPINSIVITAPKDDPSQKQ